MNKGFALRLGGFIGAAGVTAALVGTAVTGTGAYFSDSRTGTVTGSLGSITLSTGGSPTNDTTLAFTDMLPGEGKTQKVDFTNTGHNPQDVWVVFNQGDMGDGSHLTDTNLINDHGTYGEVLIKSSGVDKFWSNNLNDDAASCPPGAGAPGPVCNPVPHMIKLAENLAPAASGNMEFTYTPAAKLKSSAQENGPAFAPIDYAIVATQHGIAPDDALNTQPISAP